MDFGGYLGFDVLEDSHAADEVLSVPTCKVTSPTGSEDHVFDSREQFWCHFFLVVDLVQATQVNNSLLQPSPIVHRLSYTIRLIPHLKHIIVIYAFGQFDDNFFLCR